MPKGKPWSKEKEKALIAMVKKRRPIDVIAKALETTEGNVYMKMKRLGLEVVVSEKNQLTTTTKAAIPDDLPSIENVMKRLSAALSTLEQPGIEKKEIIRLRSFIQGVKIYKELFTDFVHYSEIEAALAISLHNYKDVLKTVPFEDYPLAFLLVLTDELQEWSRPVPVPVKDTYFTTNIEKVALLDAIFYSKPKEFWEIPYTNVEAKKLSDFDFRQLCKDKANALGVLDCTEQFPESEVQLRNVEMEKTKKEESYNVEMKTK